MNDDDFVKELAHRLNTFLERSPDRASVALSTPLTHAGYAGVAHLLGELAMPSWISDSHKISELSEALFLYPQIENNHLMRFEVIRGSDLAKRAEEDQKSSVH